MAAGTAASSCSARASARARRSAATGATAPSTASCGRTCSARWRSRCSTPVRCRVSASPERRDLEGVFLELWASGQNTSIAGRAACWSSARRAVAPRPRCSTAPVTATSRTATPTPTAMRRTETARTVMPEREVDLDRLDFVLPDFTRLAWVSDHAQETWQPRVARITAAWLDIEWRAVLAGVRRCALTMCTPEEFLDKGATVGGRRAQRVARRDRGPLRRSRTRRPRCRCAPASRSCTAS